MIEWNDKKLMYLVGALQECEDVILADQVIDKAMKYGYKLFDDFSALLTKEEQLVFNYAFAKIKDLEI